MLIKLDKDFMLNTDAIVCLKIERNGLHVKLEYETDARYWSFNDVFPTEKGMKKAQEKFDEISLILEKAVNLKIDKNGAFICSHCGAPNGEK